MRRARAAQAVIAKRPNTTKATEAAANIRRLREHHTGLLSPIRVQVADAYGRLGRRSPITFRLAGLRH